jgi:hypothetical protein
MCNLYWFRYIFVLTLIPLPDIIDLCSSRKGFENEGGVLCTPPSFSNLPVDYEVLIMKAI